MLQHGEVELASARSVLLLPRHDAVRELAASWKASGLEIVETDAPEALAGSFFLWQLLFLPAALCHSTLGHLLAAEAGREIALGVLEEGLAAFRRLGRPAPGSCPCTTRRTWPSAWPGGRRSSTPLDLPPDRAAACCNRY